MATNNRKPKPLRFKQIAVGQYRTKDGVLSFVPIGLSTDGQVYKFLLNDGWILLEDAAANYLAIREELEDERMSAAMGDIFG